MTSTNSNEGKAENQAQAEKEAKIESEIIYTGKKIKIQVDHITLKSGHKYKREIVVHPGAVVMIPVDNQGRILLVKQWRRASGRVLIELPAGTLDNNEDPRECAQRELQEEIGYKAGKLTSLGGFFSAPGYSTEYLHLFLAEDLSESQLQPDENEEIEILPLTPAEALKMVENNGIRDAKSVVGIYRYNLQT